MTNPRKIRANAGMAPRKHMTPAAFAKAFKVGWEYKLILRPLDTYTFDEDGLPVPELCISDLQLVLAGEVTGLAVNVKDIDDVVWVDISTENGVFDFSHEHVVAVEELREIGLTGIDAEYELDSRGIVSTLSYAAEQRSVKVHGCWIDSRFLHGLASTLMVTDSGAPLVHAKRFATYATDGRGKLRKPVRSQFDAYGEQWQVAIAPDHVQVGCRQFDREDIEEALRWALERIPAWEALNSPPKKKAKA